MTQAFEGIKILDFTQVLAGPFAVMQLALLGADVIKIEQPVVGDQTRQMGSADKTEPVPISFMGMNLNKKSITLNLKSAEALVIVKKLLLDTDVVVENFKAGTMHKLGLGSDQLLEIKPDLIYCSVSGYGQKGPKAGAAAYDGAIQAASGMMSLSGHVQTGPTRAGFMPVDMSTALYAAFAISASLFRRAATGKGQYIDLAMMDTAVVLQAPQYNSIINGGPVVGLMGNASPTGQPTANVFATKDGFVQITAMRQSQVEKLFATIGRVSMLEKQEFGTPAARVKNSKLVTEFLNDALIQSTTGHWMHELEAVGVPVAEVRELKDVRSDPQFDYRRTFETIDNGSEDNIELVTAGYVANEDGPRVNGVAPCLGEHTVEILTSLGYSPNEIELLRENAVI